MLTGPRIFACNTLRMLHVILPTDFSHTSFKAMQFAVDVFGTEGVRYTLLNTYLKQAYRNALVPVHLDTARRSRNGLLRMKRGLHRHAPGAQVALRSTFEQLANAINRLHGKQPADYVVMGAQGQGNYGRVGRNTGMVVTGSRVPVITVPAEWEPAPLLRIVFGDDSGALERQTLRPMVRLAKWAKARVEVVHVRKKDQPDDRAERRVMLGTWLHDLPHGFSLLTGNDITATVDRFVAGQKAQLVVLVHRQKGFWERLFKASTSKRMAMYTSVPLLVLQET